MASVNKNFVIKNGVEVATDLIIANLGLNGVGIGSTIPGSKLDVTGNIRGTGVQVNGIGTIRDTLNVGTGGTIFNADPLTDKVGIRTSSPNYDVEIAGIVGISENDNVVLYANPVTKKVGINSTTPRSDFDVRGGIQISGISTFDSNVSIADKIIHTGDTDTAIKFPSADTVSIETGGAERLRITSNDKVLVGTVTERSIEIKNQGLNSNQPSKVVFEDTGGGNINLLTLVENHNSVYGPTLSLAKSRGTSDASVTLVNNGDTLGQLQFAGADGTNLSAGAAIVSKVDGAPGTNDIPGNLIFATSSDGTDSPAERMTINSSGTVSIPSAGTLDVDGHTELDNLNVSGVSTFAGNITANGNLIPSSDSSKDLGSNAVRWANIYVDTITSNSINGAVGAGDLNVTGISTFGGNINIADKIVHTGDTNTSIRFPANDTIAAETSGAERLRISSGGNIGIGVTNPESYHANANSLVIDGGITFNDTASSYLYWTDDTNSTNKGQIGYVHTTDSMHFVTNQLERLRISSGGNIGIGTSNPETYHANANALVIDGGITFADTSSGYLFWSDDVSSTNKGQIGYVHATDSMHFVTNNAERLTINSVGVSSFYGNVNITTDLDVDGHTELDNLNVSGVSTFAGNIVTNGNLSIGGVLTYEDVTNIDSVGVITARSGVNVNSGNTYKINGTDVLSATTLGSNVVNSSLTSVGTLGSLGIGIANPESYHPNANALVVDSGITFADTTSGYLYWSDDTNSTNKGQIGYVHATDSMHFVTNNAERLRISSGGNIGIGTANPETYHANANALVINGGITFADTSSGYIFWSDDGNTSNRGQLGYVHSTDTMSFVTNNGERMTINSSGTVNIPGSLTAGSKSFKIPHPLPSKSETHNLLHSSIEGPQADLIYRGESTLVGGIVTVNIDTAGRMTEGTFELLCTNISCFTSNETDWTPVKGSVSGNILTIQAQDSSSTAKISWMVVGERKDENMINLDITDSNGRLITEPSI